jgi:asparagine synthase (glutamine-hydrolysing)
VTTNCDLLGDELASSVGTLVKKRGCDCILFSGGIDTSFVAAAAVEAGLRPRLITVKLPGSADSEFSGAAAKALGLELTEARSDDAIIEECKRTAISVTRSIDPVEIAADTAACLGIRAAREVGCRCIATGDGGDELFLGYPFLFSYDDRGVERWYSRVLTGSRFASRELGFALGVRVELPLYTDDARSIALKTPLRCKVDEIGGRIYGKVLMRKRLERFGLGTVAWRSKVPVTDGSGATGLIARWSSRVDLERSVELFERVGITFPSRAHVHLYMEMEDMCMKKPGRCSDERGRCPTCGSCMDDNFCRFCGTYMGDGGTTSHYSDELWEELRGMGKLS